MDPRQSSGFIVKKRRENLIVFDENVFYTCYGFGRRRDRTMFGLRTSDL
jgi:hypothetical protein